MVNYIDKIPISPLSIPIGIRCRTRNCSAALSFKAKPGRSKTRAAWECYFTSSGVCAELMEKMRQERPCYLPAAPVPPHSQVQVWTY